MNAMLTKEDLLSIREVVRNEIKVPIEVLREDLKGDFRYLNAQIGRLDAKIDGVEQRLEKKIDHLTTAVDGLAGNQRKFEVELAAQRSALQRLGPSPA